MKRTPSRHLFPAAAVVLLLPGMLLSRKPLSAQPAVAPPEGAPGLHITQTRRVSFNYNMTDGKGFLWDIQYYASIGQGTNNAYGSGLYSQINGSNIQSNGYGYLNDKGDELEIGPYNWNNQIQAWRRVRVYQDQGLARWLDIYQNTTGSPVTIQVRIHTNFNYGIQQTITVSGGSSFGAADWAFITKTNYQQAPAILHVVCGKKSKLRPTVQTQNSYCYVNYSLTIPAGGTSVLCYFESQANSVEEHQATLKKFRLYRLLKDLSPAVRKLIVNFTAGGDGEVELERSDTSDRVQLANGDPLLGTISSERFEVETLFGKLTLPGGKVVGMASAKESGGASLFVLTDGQVVSGRTPAGATLRLTVSASGTPLTIPFEKVRQWSYRISKERPEEATFSGPLAVLRTGDRLAFDPAALKLQLRTRHGTVDLAGSELLDIRMDNPGNALHRVAFLNTSQLAGMILPEKIRLELKLGSSVELPRDMIAQLRFAAEEKPAADLDRVLLANGDELFGRATDKAIRLATEFTTEPMSIPTSNVRALELSPTHIARAAVQMWDGSVLRGELSPAELTFAVAGGPTLRLHAGEVLGLLRTDAVPPEDLVQKVDKLVAQLGAESHEDREAAMKELEALKGAIVPLLKKHLSSTDPEVRHRVKQLLEKLGEGEKPSGPDGPPGLFDGAIRG